jgi:hypothetical protein
MDWDNILRFDLEDWKDELFIIIILFLAVIGFLHILLFLSK